MSEFAKKVKRWYELGIWDAERVREAVVRGKIREEELGEILCKDRS